MKKSKDIKVKRRELKYYISYPEYKILSNRLKKFLKMDSNCKNSKPYFIRSVYFDTLHNDDFFDKISGVEARKKIRIRAYDLKGDIIKLEIKSKMNNSILKESAFISRSDAEHLQKGNFDVLLRHNEPVLNKVYAEFKKNHYKPAVMVDYLREAYIYDLNNIRITFDQLVSSRSADISIFSKDLYMKPFLQNNIVVLEIKYDHTIPSWIRELLQIPYFTKSAISKYALSRISTG